MSPRPLMALLCMHGTKSDGKPNHPLVLVMVCSSCSLGSNTDSFYTDWEETFDSFDQMGLHENLLRGIYAYGAPFSPWLTSEHTKWISFWRDIFTRSTTSREHNTNAFQ